MNRQVYFCRAYWPDVTSSFDSPHSCRCGALLFLLSINPTDPSSDRQFLYWMIRGLCVMNNLVTSPSTGWIHFHHVLPKTIHVLLLGCCLTWWSNRCILPFACQFAHPAPHSDGFVCKLRSFLPPPLPVQPREFPPNGTVLRCRRTSVLS